VIKLCVILTAFFAVALCLVGPLEAGSPGSAAMPPGAKLYISPMEWDLDKSITGEIHRQGLNLQLVATPEEADFVMTSLYQGLGTHMMSAGHYIQVKIVTANSGKQVWFGEAHDYALLLGRLRPHGPGRAAKAIVNKLRSGMTAR
jgi:hypothetical protein